MQKIWCKHAVLDNGRAAQDVVLNVDDAGWIVNIETDAPPADAEVIDGWAVPGFVDTHSHGGANADFADEDPARVTAAIEMHRGHGTTTLFASTVTESIPDLCRQIGTLRQHIAAGELDGIHLEGPFLAPEKKGAHREHLLISPSPAAVAELLEASQGAVKMITMAPELSDALDATRTFVQAGVAVAFGHSDADQDLTAAGVDAGMNIATHLFNAMRPIHHREPGPIPQLLTDDRVAVELICDGVHVHPAVVRMAIAAAGVERVLLVTDAMSATGAADGEYQLGGLPVRVIDGTAKLINADGSLGAIAGSTLTMDRAFSFVVQEVGCSIVDAAKMAAINPARVHGLAKVGQLSVGRRADLCVVNDDGELQRVMRRAAWVG